MTKILLQKKFIDLIILYSKWNCRTRKTFVRKIAANSKIFCSQCGMHSVHLHGWSPRQWDNLTPKQMNKCENSSNTSGIVELHLLLIQFWRWSNISLLFCTFCRLNKKNITLTSLMLFLEFFQIIYACSNFVRKTKIQSLLWFGRNGILLPKLFWRTVRKKMF